MIREALASFNDGDWERALANADPAIVIDNSGVAGEWRGVHQGPEAARRMFQAFSEPWASVRLEVEELIDGPGGVVSRTVGVFVGRDNIELRNSQNWCWTFDGETVTRILISNDPGAAYEAAGLSPRPDGRP